MSKPKEWYENTAITTPAYVFDLDVLTQRVDQIRAALPSSTKLAYAMKANPFIIDAIADHVDYFEVCSPGEFKICEMSQIPMEKVIMSGVYKSEEEIDYAFQKYGATVTYTVESLEQWRIMQRLALSQGLTVNVIVRLTSGNQFGIDAKDIYEFLATTEHVAFEVIGVQYFSGTMKCSQKKYQRDLKKVMEMIQRLEETYGWQDLKVEYGPGLAIDYFDEEPTMETEILEQLNESLLELDPERAVTLEMGRYMTASCGSYVTTVVDQKTIKQANYCIVDGGINHVNYYGQNMAMKCPPIQQSKATGTETAWTIFGALCTTSDILARNVPFLDLAIGDRLLFERTGAYSMTEGISLFLSRSMPYVYFTSQAAGLKMVRDKIETYTMNYIERGN